MAVSIVQRIAGEKNRECADESMINNSRLLFRSRLPAEFENLMLAEEYATYALRAILVIAAVSAAAPALDGSSCQFRHIRLRLAFFPLAPGKIRHEPRLELLKAGKTVF